MAVPLTTLVEEADRYLGSAKIADYCPNGLQVEGRPQVRRIVSGVTASQALIEAPSTPRPTCCWCTTATSGRARTLASPV